MASSEANTGYRMRIIWALNNYVKLIVTIELLVNVQAFGPLNSSIRRKYIHVGSASASMQKTLLELSGPKAFDTSNISTRLNSYINI